MAMTREICLAWRDYSSGRDLGHAKSGPAAGRFPPIATIAPHNTANGHVVRHAKERESKKGKILDLLKFPPRPFHGKQIGHKEDVLQLLWSDFGGLEVGPAPSLALTFRFGFGALCRWL